MVLAVWYTIHMAKGEEKPKKDKKNKGEDKQSSCGVRI